MTIKWAEYSVTIRSNIRYGELGKYLSPGNRAGKMSGNYFQKFRKPWNLLEFGSIGLNYSPFPLRNSIPAIPNSPTSKNFSTNTTLPANSATST